MRYNVVLEIFEGPLDLLLHLIDKNEVDIRDIPISKITEQYLEYLEKMKDLDLEITSEFLLMAATLLEIKSKMLLPKKKDEGKQLEIEEVDPREDLVKKLIDYKRFKEAAIKLKEREELQRKLFFKPREEIDLDIRNENLELENVKIEDLFKIFCNIMKRNNIETRKIKIHEIKRDEISIEESMKRIEKILNEKKTVTFSELFDKNSSRIYIVVTFLSLLELMRLKVIAIKQEKNFGNIYITLKH
ncbi:chromosome segregation protein ScpA [Caloranaerobacter azorensis H53214]|uniref:Segregation and condensation protein A n=1 Tax=Caloranaerobacter azorensis H53214 TaxID=1156417 RepID=A0A096BJK6_9FIRM|nr:segregation/condensation protein A [Caloranaerobacter azorensis]KGG81395.1 chromosome segregation protein ScpA [Caloranaerobacter azorensis H53214]